MIMNTLNRRAAWRTWPLTKWNVPVKIPGGGGAAPRPLPMLRHWNVFATSRFRYIEGLFHISRLWVESRKSFTEDFVILVQYSNKFMHGFVKFLIVLLRSLLLCFCTVFNVKTIQYNAIHKFVGVLDNPPKLMLSEGWKCYCRDPIVQNLPGEHAPGPPKQLAPSALVIGPPNKSNIATAQHFASPLAFR